MCPKPKNKPQICTYVVEQVRDYTKASAEGKKPCPGGQPVMLDIILFHMYKMMMLFSLACTVTGFLTTQIPAAMIGTGWCHLCLCLRDKTSSECFSSELIG